METRRVFRIRESYAVFLPKAWCEKNSIGERSEVNVMWEEDVVVVRPARPRSFTARVSSPDMDTLVKLLMAALVSGYDEVRLEVRGLDLELRHKIMSVARGLYMLPMEEGPDYIVFKVEDVKFDREKLIARMVSTLAFMIDHLVTAPKVNPALLESVDDEVDRYRHMIERLCHKYPTGLCASYVQLARYVERAADHIVELARLEPPKELIGALRDAVAEFVRSSSADDLRSVFAFIEATKKTRFLLQQLARDEITMLHADRVVDYLTNAAEVYIDMLTRRSPTAEI
ncbi:transcriptional regulator [Thermoproteus sp. CP80]|jgi:phosphate uptake regulator|uniref:PhoU domain-containing protein n=1 Tax=Thermoproteus sp. CP80 TaxID=1650659 RepID=UPI0009BD6C99|nr:PhoU domain-containing protein [Thermoproteus sp. CP80]PLC65943.1 transcriptional regulator [Thermoproteus sp. CP80]